MKGDFDALLNLHGSKVPSKKLPPVLLNLRNTDSFKPASSQDSTASFASATSNNSEVVSEAAGPTQSSTATRTPPACSSDSSNDESIPAVGMSTAEVAANGQAGYGSSRAAADVACEAGHGRPESSQSSAELKGDSTAKSSVNGTTSMTADLPPPSEQSGAGPLHHASAAVSTGDAGGEVRMLGTSSSQHGRPAQGTGQGEYPPEAAVSSGGAAPDPGAQDLPGPAHRLRGSAAEQSASEQPAPSEEALAKGHLAFHDPLQSSHRSHDAHESSAAPSSAEQQPLVDGAVISQQRTEAGGAREQERQRHVRETSLDAWMQDAQLQPRALGSPEEPGDFRQVPEAGASRAGVDEDQCGEPSKSKHVRDSHLPFAANGRAGQSDEVQRNSQHLGSAGPQQSHRKQSGAPGISGHLGTHYLQAADDGREQPSQLHGQRTASPGPEPSEELPVSTLGARCLSGALGASLPEPPGSAQALPGAQAGGSVAEQAEEGIPSQPGGLTCLCQQPAAVSRGPPARTQTHTTAWDCPLACHSCASQPCRHQLGFCLR